MAGIEDDDIGGGGIGRLDKALGSQEIGHALAVVDVHLAAEGFDVQRAAVRPVPQIGRVQGNAGGKIVQTVHHPAGGRRGAEPDI